MYYYDVKKSWSRDVILLKNDSQVGGGCNNSEETRTDIKLLKAVIECDALRRKALLFMMLFSSDSECWMIKILRAAY